MTYYYRNPLHEDQQRAHQQAYQQQQFTEVPQPPRKRHGCLKVLAALAALTLIVVGVFVAFTMHAANQVREEVSANHPTVDRLLEEHDMSMLDLLLLGRELEGASQEEVIQRAQEMGITEAELRELAADSEVRDLINDFLNR